MLKSLIITGHLLGIFLLSFLFSDEITITDTFPDSLKVDENYTVTTTVVKNDVSGFAKYQIDAPRGVVIKPIDLNGASFTFKDGKAKFIWMNLPNTPSFDIQYEVTLEDGEIGSDKEVNSRLSYLVENERKIHEGPNHLLKVVGDNVTAANTQSSTNSEISATRKITDEGNNIYLVEIEVNKLGVKGFAKIQDMIPDGFVATEVMNSEAIFTQSNNKVKLVWFDIPKNISLNVSYQLEAPTDFQGDADISGKFHYMAGSDLKKVDVPSRTISIGGAIANNSSSPENNTTSTTVDNNSTIDSDNVVDNNDSTPSEVESTTDTESSIWDTEFTDDKAEDVSNTVSEVANNSVESVTEVAETNSASVEEVADNSSSEISSSVSNNNTIETATNVTENVGNKIDESTDTKSNSKGGNTIDDLIDGNSLATNNDVSTSNSAVDNSSSNEEQNEIVEESSKSDLIDVYIDDQNNISTKPVADVASNNKTESSESVANSSTEYSNINDIAIENSSSTNSVDMSTEVAEPESTAVAKKDYAKDEVLADSNSLNSVSNMTDVDKGINYRVQILAGKNVVGKEYLRKRHSYNSQFTIENHEGWVKYTSGSYETYKVARDQRNMIRDQYNFDGPFVSAYNDGVRITVQEALMISKQQWYN